MNQTSPLLNAVKIVVIAVGLFITAMGVLAGIGFIIQLLLSGGEIPVDSAVASASFAVLGIGLGGALAWQAGRSFMGYVSAEFRLPSIWWLLLLYIPVIIIGQLIITFDIFPALTLFPFHILAASIPPLAILAYAGRALNPATLRWREIIVQLSSGAFLATLVAFIAEIVIGLILLLLAIVITALTPGGREFLEELAVNIQDPFWVQDPANIQEVLLFPPIAISIAMVFIILAPALEELVKPLGIVLMSYRRPSRAQVFIWGLAGGAGFALVENLFNTVLALDVWAFVMLLRIGGTAMHSLGTGLMGLGWYHTLITRRPWRLAGAYVLSVSIHALWNGAVIGITGTSLLAVDASSEITVTLVGGVVIILLGVLVLLTLALIIVIVILTKRLQTEQAITP